MTEVTTFEGLWALVAEYSATDRRRRERLDAIRAQFGRLDLESERHDVPFLLGEIDRRDEAIRTLTDLAQPGSGPRTPRVVDRAVNAYHGVRLLLGVFVDWLRGRRG